MASEESLARFLSHMRRLFPFAQNSKNGKGKNRISHKICRFKVKEGEGEEEREGGARGRERGARRKGKKGKKRKKKGKKGRKGRKEEVSDEEGLGGKRGGQQSSLDV